MAITPYFTNGEKLFEVYVNGNDSAGRRIQWRRTGIDTLRKAEVMEFELKRKLAQIKEQKVPFRWSEWRNICEERMRLECRPSTIQNYRGTVAKWADPHWDNLEINTITKSMVYDIVFSKNDLGTANSRKNLLKMIRRLFQMAVEEGHLTHNPCLGISIKVPDLDQKVFTNSEAEIFLKEAKVVNHRFYSIWAMALLTGMRSGELFALKWTDIDFDSRIISVSRQWTSKNGFGPTKTRLNRVVPISDDLMKFLKELKLQRGSEEFILPHLDEWIHGDQARVTKDFCQAIGITQVKFHDLRATFITNLLSRGESLARVMSIVGHTELKTTNGYLRRAGVDVQGATDKLGYNLPEERPAAAVISILKGGLKPAPL